MERMMMMTCLLIYSRNDPRIEIVLPCITDISIEILLISVIAFICDFQCTVITQVFIYL